MCSCVPLSTDRWTDRHMDKWRVTKKCPYFPNWFYACPYFSKSRPYFSWHVRTIAISEYLFNQQSPSLGPFYSIRGKDKIRGKDLPLSETKIESRNADMNVLRCKTVCHRQKQSVLTRIDPTYSNKICLKAYNVLV